MTANTPTWALPFPDDYQQPADSPNALEDLAVATDAAITNLQAQGRGEFVPARVQITDWNAAVTSGVYVSSPGAANEPATGIGSTAWVGAVDAWNVAFVHQMAWPHGLYPNVTMHRRMIANVWEPWSRLANYHYSWATGDNFTFLRHGSPELSRFAHGMAKDPLNGYPSDSDEWRVQCYDPAGNFTWSAIKIPENGIVSMPRGHALALERLAAGEELDDDQAVTVGMLRELLRRAGLDEVQP